MSERAAVFLDRDGTIIVERDYLHDPAQLELVPGATQAIRALKEAGLAVVVVTNQAGIARGMYDHAAYDRVARRLDEMLVAEGAGVEATYYCPHHPDFTGPCMCRKPAAGLYRQAAADLHVALPRSFYVGDKTSDVEVVSELGGRGILVRTGYGTDHEDRVSDAVWVVDDLGEAASRIVSDLRR